MENSLTSYSVEIEPPSPGAWIHYREPDLHLRFWWEYLSDGASLSVPSPAEWDAWCVRSDAVEAKGRRREIVDRVVQEIGKKAPTMIVDDRGDWLYLKF